MWALLCWIGVVLFAMLGTGGVLVGVSNLAWAPVGVGAAALLACWGCWGLARRLSANQLASAGAPARRDPDDDDDDNSGSFASALLASGLHTASSGPSQAALTSRIDTAFEPLECRADNAEANDEDRSDNSDCGSNDDSSDSSSDSDSGSDNSSSD
jgi:hypothetical protein